MSTDLGSSRERKARRCIGFGEREGCCAAVSDLEMNGSGLFCTYCERQRRAHITEQMERITANFEVASRG